MACASVRDPSSENVLNIDNVLAMGRIKPVIDFPKSVISGKDFRFQKRWYEQYDSLEYSIDKDAIFCFYFRIFWSQVGCSEKIFTEDGFRNWKKATGATGRLEKHLKSRAHQLSREKAILRKTSIPINVQLFNAEAARISKLEAEKKENQKVVEVIIDVIGHISLQNEAFRGHD
eukprot:gene15570-17146_t